MTYKPTLILISTVFATATTLSACGGKTTEKSSQKAEKQGMTTQECTRNYTDPQCIAMFRHKF